MLDHGLHGHVGDITVVKTEDPQSARLTANLLNCSVIDACLVDVQIVDLRTQLNQLNNPRSGHIAATNAHVLEIERPVCKDRTVFQHVDFPQREMTQWWGQFVGQYLSPTNCERYNSRAEESLDFDSTWGTIADSSAPSQMSSNPEPSALAFCVRRSSAMDFVLLGFEDA